MTNKQTILVIEDEKIIGSYIETILISNEYKVLRAMNGMTGHAAPCIRSILKWSQYRTNTRCCVP